MTIPDTLSNILIEGNTIDAGSSLTYGTLLSSGFADCRIFGNYFSGIANDSVNSNMLVLAGCSCNVQGNTFVRGASSIASFILTDTSNDHMITNNVFDGYTTDGTNTLLITGASSNTLYTSNKNQVGYSIIPLGTNKPGLFGINKGIISSAYFVFDSHDAPPSLGSTDYGVTSGFLFDPYVLTIYDTVTSPGFRFFSTNIDITKSIPVGAKIIDAKMSVFSPSSVGFTGTNTFSLSLLAGLNHTQSIDTQTYDNAGTLSTMIGFVASQSLTVNSNVPDLRSAYQAIEIPTLNYTGNAGPPSSIVSVSDTDISTQYVSGNDYGLSATIRFSYQASGATSASPYIPLLIVSPLIITYVF